MTDPSDRNADEDLDRLIEMLSQDTSGPAQSQVGSTAYETITEGERLAAGYAIGRLPELQKLPKGVERRLLHQAHRLAEASRPPRRRWSFASLLGDWELPALCASLVLVSFVAARLLPTDFDPFAHVPQAEAGSTYPWAPGPDPAGARVHGYVSWRADRNSGYVVFEGLKPNDAKREQYQLWIVDADRDTRYPVDGGVFDVPNSDHPARVNVSPRLRVGHPAAFVVTVEQPGGVVVSDRGRIVAIAKVGTS